MKWQYIFKLILFASSYTKVFEICNQAFFNGDYRKLLIFKGNFSNAYVLISSDSKMK